MIQTNVSHPNNTSRRIRRYVKKQDTQSVTSPVSTPSPTKPPSKKVKTKTVAKATVAKVKTVKKKAGASPKKVKTKTVAKATVAKVKTVKKKAGASLKKVKTKTVAKATVAKVKTVKKQTGVTKAKNTVTAKTAKKKTSVTKAKVKKTKTVKKKSAPPPATSSLKKSSQTSHPVDVHVGFHKASVPISLLEVVQNADGLFFDAIFNQCDITEASNSNKFYCIQMLKKKSNDEHYVWTKWGRVGEVMPRCDMQGPYSSEYALKVYAQKYRSKTGNKYDADEFVPKKGKYHLIEIDKTVKTNSDEKAKTNVEYLPSVLEEKTKELMNMLFSDKVRDEALSAYNLDLKRLPLGVPSIQQIELSISILGEIEDRLMMTGQEDDDDLPSFSELSSRFYSSLPHSFPGMTRPVIIDTSDKLQGRYDMCNVLLDMHSTNEARLKVETETNKVQKVTNPADSYYKSMNADLRLLDETSEEYDRVKKYFENTKNRGGSDKLLDIWAVNRLGEDQRFKVHDTLDNRRLLWHGTNIAVVAPILTSGLRIMPHSGGRVGAGIYLASMQLMSSGYMWGRFGCMFLVEAALGRSKKVYAGNMELRNLKMAPPTYSSVHAVGRTQPAAPWASIKSDGKDLQIPQSHVIVNDVVKSEFAYDEFLVYDEAQVRIRYIVTVKK